jgi:hypothetical protein
VAFILINGASSVGTGSVCPTVPETVDEARPYRRHLRRRRGRYRPGVRRARHGFVFGKPDRRRHRRRRWKPPARWPRSWSPPRPAARQAAGRRRPGRGRTGPSTRSIRPSSPTARPRCRPPARPRPPPEPWRARLPPPTSPATPSPPSPAPPTTPPPVERRPTISARSCANPSSPESPSSRARSSAPATAAIMAAYLEPGMRAMAIRVTVETAAGGFILPGDRVDVLLTRETSLSNVDNAGQRLQIRVVHRDAATSRFWPSTSRPAPATTNSRWSAPPRPWRSAPPTPRPWRSPSPRAS